MTCSNCLFDLNELPNNSKIDTENNNVEKIKAQSAPIITFKSSAELLGTQISAPSYLHSLKENGAPPFGKPDKERKPQLLIGTIVTEKDLVEMIAVINTDNGFKKYIGKYLVNKNVVVNHNLHERDFLISLVLECIDYSAQRDFPAFKVACLLTIYLTTHMYFKFYYWLPPKQTWHYFKELMIRHTIQDSPDGQEVFSPEESYDILSHFHSIYLSNLPLIHIQTFGVYRLKLVWPFKPK